MTEKDIINTTLTSEENKKDIDTNVEKIQTDPKKEEKKTTNRSTHKQSNLRGRWKRNQVVSGIATIKEDNTKLPKEIKTVKISTAEHLNSKTNNKKKQNSENKPSKNNVKTNSSAKPKTSCKHKCFCSSYWFKFKCFLLNLFGFKPRKNCSSHKHHHKHSRNRYFHHNSHHNK